VRGSYAALSAYQTLPTVSEKIQAVLEFNVNASFPPSHIGYYLNQWTPTTTFSYSGSDVTGASFATKSVTVTKTVVSGTEDSQIEELRYEDEEDKKYEGLFPVESIAYVDRPSPGAAKWVNSRSGFQVPGPHVKFYSPGLNDNIKYWRSWCNPAKRTRDAADPFGTVLGSNRIGYNMGPFVVYKPQVNDRGIWINKVRISLQNYYALPTDYKIEALFEGSQNWTSIWSSTDSGSSSTNEWPLDGILKIYYNDSAWSTTHDLTRLSNLRDPSIVKDAIKIRGIRLSVKKMRTFNAGRASLNYSNTISEAPLEVIEISPRLALDVSDSIMDGTFSMTHNISESDSPLPVGSISANDCKITLENYGDYLDVTNVMSLINGYQFKNAVLDVYSTTKEVGSSGETNRLFYGHIEDSIPDTDKEIELTALDGMSRLQQEKLYNFVMTKKRVSTIVNTILDLSTGHKMVFDRVTPNLNSEDPYINFFYINGETAYEVLADLAEAHQMAMYFDSDNVFHLASKEYLTEATVRPYQMTFSTSDIAGTLANIKEISTRPGKPVNEIEIEYNPHYLPVSTAAEGEKGKALWLAQQFEVQEPAWSAEDTVIGAAPLVRPILSSAIAGDAVTIDQEGGQYYDWSGYFLVNDEVISYDAKQYHCRYEGNAGYSYVWISDEENYRTMLSSISPGTRAYFTGNLRIASRGAFNTVVGTHNVDTSSTYPYANASFPGFQSWKICYYLNGSTTYANNRGVSSWKFTGGTAYSLRGSSSGTGQVTRNGSEGAIRMVGPTQSSFKSYTATKDIAATACTSAAHVYVGWAPLDQNGVRIAPLRISAGIRILGRVKDDGTVLGPYGVNGSAGVILSGGGSAGQLDGWCADVTLTSSEGGDGNIRLYKLDNNAWGTPVATGTYIIAPHLPTNNTYTSTSNNYYDVDIAYFDNLNKAGRGIQVSINGKAVISYNLKSTDVFSKSFVYGMYVRGHTFADFDYIYWSRLSDENRVEGYSASSVVDSSKITIRDAISGGVTGPAQWWAQGSEVLTNPYKSSNYLFGLYEFGPITHEMRVFRPKWEKPYLNTQVSTPPVNITSYKIPYKWSDRFSAEMVVLNSRRNAVNISGDGSVGLTVKGVPIEMLEEKYSMSDYESDVTATTAPASRVITLKTSKKIHGAIPMTLNSKWIQSRGQAKGLFSWIADKAAKDCDIVEMSIFGNPLIEPGDLIRIYAPEVDYTNMAYRFLVVSVDNSFDSGLKTEITARRVA
jgi:hypothetical protein